MLFWLSVLLPAISNEPDPCLLTQHRNYTSYFTNELHQSPKEYFERLVDKDRLPIQLGATLTVLQRDYSAEGFDAFTVSDQRPSSVLVNITLGQGNINDTQVALEGFPVEPDSPRGGYEWLFDESLPSLPTKLQVHASGPVCIKSVDLLFRNSTDYAHVAMSIPASIFSSCLDFNVCSDENKGSNACGRSLAYYNPDLDCLELQTNDVLYPRDLALDLYSTSCQRLTTWNHPDLGEPFLLELQHSEDNLENITLREVASDIHRYTFGPNEQSVVINEDSRLPFKLLLGGGNGAQEVGKFSITRYGKDVSYVDFRANYNCIYLCSAIASDSGISLGPIHTVYLSMLEPFECLKVDYLVDENGVTGREICTSPQVNITSIDELQSEIASIAPTTSPFRSILAKVTEKELYGVGDLLLPSHRGLRLSVERSTTNGQDAAIKGVHFVVERSAELTINGFDLRNSSTVTVNTLGEVELESCYIASPMVNYGSTFVSGTEISGSTVLTNHGLLDLTYVTFGGASSIVNTASATLRSSRLKLYEEFVILTSLPGMIELPDAERLYSTVEDTDSLCLGDFFPTNSTLELSSVECKGEKKCLCPSLFLDPRSVLILYNDPRRVRGQLRLFGIHLFYRGGDTLSHLRSL